MALRRKRIDAAFRDAALTQLSRLSISVDPDTDVYAWTVILQLADRFQLTLYDAAYLELAGRRRLPLATLTGIAGCFVGPWGLSFLALTQRIERLCQIARIGRLRNWRLSTCSRGQRCYRSHTGAPAAN